MSTLQYQLLHDRLKKQILGGVYQVGDTLPSENELCSSSNLARSTVRQALLELQKEGYIIKQKGVGSIVTSKRRSLSILNFQGFSASVHDGSLSVLSVQDPKLSPWPEDFSFELSETEKKAGCISFSRVRLIEKDPVMWETSFLPNLNLPRFTQLFKLNSSFFEFMAQRYHIEITGMEQEIKALAADGTGAKYLKVKKGTPILFISRKYSTSRTSLHIYSKLFCNTENYSMSNSSGTVS